MSSSQLTTPAIFIPIPTSATFSIQIVDGLADIGAQATRHGGLATRPRLPRRPVGAVVPSCFCQCRHAGSRPPPPMTLGLACVSSQLEPNRTRPGLARARRTFDQSSAVG
jgi:hypothetical protein